MEGARVVEACDPPRRLLMVGAGVQIHVEDLAAYLGGRERCDSDARMDELSPAYEALEGSAG